MSLEVAETIREQIGQRALAMLGAKNLAGDPTSLTFKIGRNPKSVTHIKIGLCSDDTYAVTFFRIRGTKVLLLNTEPGVYVDSLHKTIEAGTGLYTSL